MRLKILAVPLLAIALAGCGDDPTDGQRGTVPAPPPESATTAESAPTQEAPTSTDPTTATPTTSETTASADADGDAYYSTLQVGDCLNSEDIMGQVGAVTLIECTDPHDAEVISSHEIAAPYPGQDAVLAQVETDCVAFGQEWAGTDPNRSTLSLGYLMPTEADFDRGITNFLCVAIAPSPVTAPF